MSDRLMRPLVTIGVPVFNGERYLRESLRSLLDQPYHSLEILISDNASTDATRAICEQAATADPRVRYVRQGTNIGGGANFNFVLREAAGELFAWHAHDDVRSPGAIERMVEALLANPAAVLVVPAVVRIDADGREIGDEPPYEPLDQDLTGRLTALARHSNNVAFYGLMRTAAARAVSPLGETINEDVRFTFELGMRGPFVQIPERLFRYRMIHTDSDYGTDFVERHGGDYVLGRRRLFLDSIARSPLAPSERREASRAVKDAVRPMMEERVRFLLSNRVPPRLLVRWARQYPPLVVSRTWWVGWRRQVISR